MIKKLASLNLTLCCLSAMIACLALGWAVSGLKAFRQGFNALNQGLVWDWLAAGPDPLLAAWLAALCLASAALLVNLVACLIDRLWPWLKGSRDPRRILLFGVHLLVGLVMLGHGASMAVGFKADRLRLLPGQTVQLPRGYALRLEAVNFVDDPALLTLDYRRARAAMTRQRFHRGQNQAQVSLLHHGQVEASGSLGMLRPLRHDQTIVALGGFILGDDGQTPPTIGVEAAVTHTPLNTAFLSAYLLMIAGFLGLTILGWRRGATGRPTD